MTHPTLPNTDRRVQRTHELIFDAFFHLVQSKRYDEIRVIDIISKANVGKSTFYDHFKDKDDVLGKSLARPLRVLARGLLGQASAADVEKVLAHFWDKRSFARVILRLETRHIFEKSLQNQLAQAASTYGHDLSPVDHYFKSSGLVSVLNQWVNGRISLSSEKLAIWVVKLNIE